MPCMSAPLPNAAPPSSPPPRYQPLAIVLAVLPVAVHVGKSADSRLVVTGEDLGITCACWSSSASA